MAQIFCLFCVLHKLGKSLGKSKTNIFFNRKITWNFPFQSNDSRQGRFIISRADIPVGSRRPKRVSRKEECTANLYDLHELVP